MVVHAGEVAPKRSMLGGLIAKCTPSDATLSRIALMAVRPLYQLCTPVRVEGIEHLPTTGPAIVAANQISFYDTTHEPNSPARLAIVVATSSPVTTSARRSPSPTPKAAD